MRFIPGEDSSHLVKRLLNTDDIVNVSLLLGRGEQYDGTDKTIKDSSGYATSIKDRLEEVYLALFTKSRHSGYRRVSIGLMCFSKNTQRTVEKTALLLSSFSDYAFE